MTLETAARLGKPKSWFADFLKKYPMNFFNPSKPWTLGDEIPDTTVPYSFAPQVIVFQIVKGGTGKTSLLYEVAVCASLYGAKVLCIDMDQQGNLTQAFNEEVEEHPVMVDCLADQYPFKNAIISVAPGIDLFPSRYDNAMLDEVIKLKGLPIESVYRDLWQPLKQQYDLILVDCPPSLGLSVAAAALAADTIVAPVTSEKFALSGLDILYQSIEELRVKYKTNVQLKIVLNKYDPEKPRSLAALEYLLYHPSYQDKMLDYYIRLSSEFPQANGHHGSIFNMVKDTTAKQDIHLLTKNLLQITEKISPPIYAKTKALEEVE